MNRRNFLKLTPAGLAGAAAYAQGREFLKNPPLKGPTSKRIYDLHVHPHLVLEKPEKPVFSPALNGSRPDGAFQVNATWEQFQFDMKPIDKACIFITAQNDVGAKDNDWCAMLAKKWPEKLIPFGSVNPTYPNALDEFKRAVKQLGIRGFKLSPNYMNFHPMDPRAVRIYEQAEEWNIPLIFHTATVQAPELPLKYANPVLFDDVAYAFPRLKMVMAHMAHPYYTECIVMIRKHPNVYAEISGNFFRHWPFYTTLLSAMDWGQTHKIFFGSDWPVATPQETIDGIRAVNRFPGFPRIPEEVLEGIIHSESLKALGIEV